MAQQKKNNDLKVKRNLQRKMAAGVFVVLISFMLICSFISYLFTWKADQSALSEFGVKSVVVENEWGKLGAFLGDIFIYKGFGITTLFPVCVMLLYGFSLIIGLRKAFLNHIFWSVAGMIYVSTFFGFFSGDATILSGVIGFELNIFLQSYLGLLGAVSVLIAMGLIYAIFRWEITPEKIQNAIQFLQERWALYRKSTSEKQESLEEKTLIKEETFIEEKEEMSSEKITISVEDTVQPPIVLKQDSQDDVIEVHQPESQVVYNRKDEIVALSDQQPPNTDDIVLEVEEQTQEEIVDVAQKLVDEFGEFDPKLELSQYRFPTLDLLNDTDVKGIVINEQELEENKQNIVQTLKHYGIDIARIQATIGPTVTLYEIVPAVGVRISKIKNLEDDIALSLSALGIRIIAPIPGKGTVGIEVPNKKPTMVSMRAMIGSVKFQSAQMELPIAFGKTISNETFVVDLAKMPHMLMAGATGQGKSVGLNVVLTSLLYKKHPAEVKFVLVDPKKVELTLFNKIERHYLAKLPNSEEAIITDNTKVIHTLNSLCIEMDERYALLQKAEVRNIKEYNTAFKNRRLNPNDGHRFLPYIVLVVDEFADLIMTAGKEVELPIARLAQLARAIGIHLIIATQRPSVNVLTGMIKANFPARVAFRVFSKIDSRTILDTNGADQLIGKGDMLFTQGSELIRLQCAFVDTPEVNRITEFIGSQRAYPQAYLLPEYVPEGGEGISDIDASERDELFKEAAEIIVIAQQGSASLLQRKLKLGYNRAGRLMDQLEVAGIVGPFEGSKARQVLVSDMIQLEQILNKS